MEYNHAVRIIMARLHFSPDRLLACQLCGTIDGVGTRSNVFRIRNMPGSIENIVRRHLYHGSATGFSRCSQIAGSYMVQLVANSGLSSALSTAV